MDPQVSLIIAGSIETAPLPERLRHPGTDVRHIITDRFSIDDARRLKEESVRAPLLGSRLVFVIVTESLPIEAQNALLKLFEEPPEKAAFYLVVPHESLIIPTLRSRFVTIERSTVTPNDSAREFIALSYAKRLELIADLAKKDPAALNKLFVTLSNTKAAENSGAKRALWLVSRYVYNRGAGRKMLLEELALSFPLTLTK